MVKFDFIVVGGGIAGLAVAELLQRSGRPVLLLESHEQLCTGSSAQQEGWFHTGALYAALPTNRYFRTMVGNLDDLFNYYGSFSGMNLSSGRYLLAGSSEGWFRNTTCYYFFVSPRDRNIPLWLKPLWYLAILRAQSRLSWFEMLDFNRELTPQISWHSLSAYLSKPLAKRRFDFEIEPVSRVLKSRDRTLESEILISDLASSFTNCGGVIKTGTKAIHVRRCEVVTSDATYQARHVVVTAGQNVGELTGIKARVVKSPILVVKPALSNVNFIVMSPVMQETMNHIHRETSCGDYSLIGNATYFDAKASVDEDEVKAKMIDKVRSIFDVNLEESNTALYFGYKTELPENGYLRNYQYQIIETDQGVVALPGKLSLMFSLAVNVCRHFGIDPVTDVPFFKTAMADGLIAPSEHYRRFLALSATTNDQSCEMAA